MKRTKGFTLLELLVVIAIIGILAAITFPVMGRVKDSAYRGSDTSNMNALRTALALYRVDQGGYPPAILGYASLYSTGSNAGNVVPATQAISFLYPRRVDSIEAFKPSYDRVKTDTISPAVWPNKDDRPARTAPYLDLNGDGSIDNLPAPTGCVDPIPGCFYDEDARARQANDPSVSVTRLLTYSDYVTGLNFNQNQNIPDAPPVTIDPVIGARIKSYFYDVSGYDIGKVKQPDGSLRVEVHYALFWSDFALNHGGDAHDDPRQLGYNDPPESTVITWNSYFREYDGNNVPTHTKRDIVLFLGGGAKPADSYDVSHRSWRITP